jgi:iron(III) transport system ATP-binding protein
MDVTIKQGLCVQGLSQNFATHQVLKAIDFELPEGKIACLLGASGSGKTTLLRTLMGFEPLSAGRVSMAGQILDDGARHLPAHERGIGMVFQEPALLGHLTVAKNIAFGLRRQSAGQVQARVAHLLELIGLSGLAERYPHQLSGGQQQRVALARALAPRPKLLLLDEPFASLDAHLRVQLAHDVRALLENEGVSAIMVTHDQAEAFAFADLLGVLQNGELAQWASPYDVYHQPPNRAVAEFVGQGVWVRGQVTDAHSVSLPLGHYFSERAHGFALGATLDVLLRPDDVLHIEDAPVMARVLGRSFRGSDFIYQLALSSGESVLAQVASHHRHAVGEMIGVQLDLNHLIAFDCI